MAFPALHHLCATLLSKRGPERITDEEYKFFSSCYEKIVWKMGFASGAAGCLAWSVSRKLTMLGPLARSGFVGGTATAVLFTYFKLEAAKTSMSCLDHILGQDGTRMQKELVNILVRYNQGEPWRWKLMSKYFYPESVYNDEVDKPQMRWRRLNTSADSVLSYDTSEAKLQSSRNSTTSNPNRSVPPVSDVSLSKPKLQNSSGNSSNEIAEDLFDCLFGGLETSESIQSPANPSGSSNAQTRKQRRAHRRQRLKNREASAQSPQHEHM